jgi:hypothetical protein
MDEARGALRNGSACWSDRLQRERLRLSYEARNYSISDRRLLGACDLTHVDQRTTRLGYIPARAAAHNLVWSNHLDAPRVDSGSTGNAACSARKPVTARSVVRSGSLTAALFMVGALPAAAQPGGPCPIISDDALSQVMGSTQHAVSLFASPPAADNSIGPHVVADRNTTRVCDAFEQALPQSSPTRTFVLALYYLLIVLGLLLLYSSSGGSMSAPPFVHQGL